MESRYPIDHLPEDLTRIVRLMESSSLEKRRDGEELLESMGTRLYPAVMGDSESETRTLSDTYQQFFAGFVYCVRTGDFEHAMDIVSHWKKTIE